jgi:hypothetical protein
MGKGRNNAATSVEIVPVLDHRSTFDCFTVHNLVLALDRICMLLASSIITFRRAPPVVFIIMHLISEL